MTDADTQPVPHRRPVVAVIPARYDSARFPGKPLALIAGRPMIEWVHRRAVAAQSVDRVLVATDDERIAGAVREFGGNAVMTAREHSSGTDRIAEALRNVPAAIVVNVQGDEPLVPPALIDRLVTRMRETGAEMGTLAVPMGEDDNPDDPNAVKVVTDRTGYALYFSRSRIPYLRSPQNAPAPLLHWGVYAYRRDLLERFVSWGPTSLEQCERLEQLRALENGVRILVVRAAETAPDVNVPEDVPRVEAILKERGEA